jgi:hypothetical protein
MTEVFDRPTPWALGGLRYQKPTGRAVRAHLARGVRRQGHPRRPLPRRRDRGRAAPSQALREGAAGQGPDAGRHARRAGRQAPIDAYGNVPGPFIVRVLSDLQAFGEQGYRANRKGKRRGARKTNYFFVPPKGSPLKPGVYWHMPGGLLGVVFVFVSSAAYRKRYDFYGVAGRAFNRKAAQFMTEALDALTAAA